MVTKRPSGAAEVLYKSQNRAIEACVHKNRMKGGKFVVVATDGGFALHSVSADGFPDAPIVWARGAEGVLERAATKRIKELLETAGRLA